MQESPASIVRCLCVLSLAAVTAPAQMELSYSSRLGSGQMVADTAGTVHVAGGARPQWDPLPPVTDGSLPDALVVWIARIDPTLSCIPPDPTNPSLCMGSFPVTTDGDIIQTRAAALGLDDDVYATGWAAVPGLGTPGTYQPNYGGGRVAFVARYSTITGQLRAWTWFYGGTAQTTGDAITVTPAGTVVVAGQTAAVIPTTSTAYRSARYGGYRDAWVAVFNADLSDTGGPDGDGLLYASYLPGGSGTDIARAAAADASGRIFVGGHSDSADFDAGAFGSTSHQTQNRGGLDGFVLSLDITQGGAASVVWGTLFGGPGDDEITSLATDGSGTVHACGTTASAGLGLQQSLAGGADAFVAAFGPGGTMPGGRYLGGSKDELAAAVRIDAQGRLVTAGTTKSSDFPTTLSAYDSSHNSRNKDDVFLTRLDASFGLLDSTYFGGRGNDGIQGESLSLDANGAAYISGPTDSTDFPTTVQTWELSGFIAKVSFEPAPPVPGITVDPTSGLVTSEAGGTATFTVVLDTQPSSLVTIGLSTSDPSEGTPSPAVLQFDASNWDQPQTVTVTGVDDPDQDGDQLYTIVTAAAMSADPDYDGLDPADVSVTNIDDDVVGVAIASIDPSSLGLGNSTMVEILGAGFATGADVTFEGGRGRGPTASQVVVVDSGTIVALVSVASQAKAGEIWDVRVTNPSGATGVLPNAFTVTN